MVDASEVSTALPRLLGDRIRHHRHRLGVSQEKLGEISGLHRAYVGRIERGEANIGLVSIVRVADALDVDPALLVGRLTLRTRQTRPDQA